MSMGPEHKPDCPALGGLECTCGAWNSVFQHPGFLVNNPNEKTLRDEFAMAALTGICSSMNRGRIEDIYYGVQGGNIEVQVSLAIADAMMKAIRNEK